MEAMELLFYYFFFIKAREIRNKFSVSQQHVCVRTKRKRSYAKQLQMKKKENIQETCSDLG